MVQGPCGFAYIQAIVDSIYSPLIGVEYILELLPYSYNKYPKYVCMLCNVQGSAYSVIKHIITFSHQMKYLVSRVYLRVE